MYKLRGFFDKTICYLATDPHRPTRTDKIKASELKAEQGIGLRAWGAGLKEKNSLRAQRSLRWIFFLFLALLSVWVCVRPAAAKLARAKTGLWLIKNLNWKKTVRRRKCYCGTHCAWIWWIVATVDSWCTYPGPPPKLFKNVQKT